MDDSFDDKMNGWMTAGAEALSNLGEERSVFWARSQAAHATTPAKVKDRRVAASLFSGGPFTGIEVITPGRAIDNMRQLDAHMIAFDGDVKSNVARDAFKTAWQTFFDGWKKYMKEHDSTWKVITATPAGVYRETETYRKNLTSFQDAYRRETGMNPTLGDVPAPVRPGVSEPADKKELIGPWGKTALVAGGIFLLVGLGYLGYAWIGEMRQTRRRADTIAEKLGEKVLGGFGHSPYGRRARYSPQYSPDEWPIPGMDSGYWGYVPL